MTVPDPAMPMFSWFFVICMTALILWSVWSLAKDIGISRRLLSIVFVCMLLGFILGTTSGSSYTARRWVKHCDAWHVVKAPGTNDIISATFGGEEVDEIIVDPDTGEITIRVIMKGKD